MDENDSSGDAGRARTRRVSGPTMILTPVRDCAIREQELMRSESVEVWKEYDNRRDKVDD